MFTTFHNGHYVPFTWITLGLDYLLWGMDARGYHLTSLILHAATAVVFYLVVLKLLQLGTPGEGEAADWAVRAAAAFAALFSALHPLRVESVAWVTERRDVLSGLFFMLAILSYLYASTAGDRRGRWMAASIAAYAISLLSKAIAMTLPLILIVLDIYPLRRLGPSARGVWKEKIPFFALALAGAATALAAVGTEAPPIALEEQGIAARVAQAAYGLIFYLWKTLIPTGLSPLYPLPVPLEPLAWPFPLSALLVVAITLVALATRRDFPAGLAVWACYVILLSPVLGVTHQGAQLVADRYSYLSCLGWAVLGGALVLRVLRACERGRGGWTVATATMTACAVVLATLGALTWRQAGFWRDSVTLWTRVLAIAPDSFIAHTNIGNAFSRAGSFAQAVRHYQISLALDPMQPLTLYQLGNVLVALGRPKDAIDYYRRSLLLNPQQAMVHFGLGTALAQQAMWGEAARHFQEALKYRPNHAETYNNLGVTLAEQGKLTEAIASYKEAIRLEPTLINAHNNLGNALAAVGKPADAAAAYEEALRLKPDYAHARFNLGRLYLSLKKRDEALREHELLLKLDPEMAGRLMEMILNNPSS